MDRCEYCQEIVLNGLKCGCPGDRAARERDRALDDLKAEIANHREDLAALEALVCGCNEFRADVGRSTKYIQKIETPLFAAQSLLAK